MSAVPGQATDPRRSPARRGRPPVGARRVGYVFAALVNAAVLWLLHEWPEWPDLSFLTREFADVLWLVDLALWLGVATNLLYVVRDPRWLTALGGVVTTFAGLVVAVRLWQAFPFDVGDTWTVLVRIAIVAAIAGSVIGIVVDAGVVVRALLRAGHAPAR